MGLTEQLAEWVLAFPRADDLPPEAKQRARYLLLDTIGCALGAVPSDTGQAVLKTAAKLGDAPTCTIIGSKLRASAPNAVLFNGALIRTLDLNDLYLGTQIGHPSDNLAVVYSVAEMAGSSGRDVLAATLLGYELYLRIRDIAKFGGSKNPWDHTSVSGVVAPAIAGRLLGLNADQLANAIGLSAAHGPVLSAVRTGQLSAAKSVSNALVASRGTMIALLAQDGLTGPRNALDGPIGIGQNALDTDEIEKIVEPLDNFRIMNVSMKTYPSIGTSQAMVAAAIEAGNRAGRPLPPIERIELSVADLPITREQIGDEQRRRPQSRESADHSFPFLISVGLMDGELSLRQFEGERWLRPEVTAMIDKLEMRTDSRLNQYTPGSFPAVIKLTLATGQTFEVEMPYPPGHPKNLNDDVVAGKFNTFARDLLTESQRSAVVRDIYALESQSSLAGIMAQTVPA